MSPPFHSGYVTNSSPLSNIVSSPQVGLQCCVQLRDLTHKGIKLIPKGFDSQGDNIYSQGI